MAPGRDSRRHRRALRNPLVGLPFSLKKLLLLMSMRRSSPIRMMIIGMRRRSPPDPDAAGFVSMTVMPDCCVDEDFQDVRLLSEEVRFAGIRLQKNTGQHGSDRLCRAGCGGALGENLRRGVSPSAGRNTLWLVGDTIWRPEIGADMLRLRPDGGGAELPATRVLIGFGPDYHGRRCAESPFYPARRRKLSLSILKRSITAC